jgi:hypothetical protein
MLPPSSADVVYKMQRRVVRFLHWMFRKHLAIVMVTAVSSWFALSFLFALFIWLAGRANPECIGGPDSFGYFSDAFILSWTTFSTVGYGCMFVGAGVPNVGKHDILKCATVNGIVSLESFFGVLFGSFISAIMFVKVARVQSIAQVEFSDPICVRYGSGVLVETNIDDTTTHRESENESESMEELGKLPCPVLEFRIANRMHHVHGGEIIDAEVNVVAVVCDTLPKSSTLSNSAMNSTAVMDDAAGNVEVADVSTNSAAKPHPPSQSNSQAMEGSLSMRRDAFEEDPSGYLVPKTMFCSVDCETREHPFFKRVFLIRHRLDHTSPLLKEPVREMIKANNGNWPCELNSAHNVKSSIHFDQLLVSIKGTSNADAKAVYARKMYEFEDVVVGYRFVTMIYRDHAGALRTNMGLLNDVVEQAGGGGEEIAAENCERKRNALYLM